MKPTNFLIKIELNLLLCTHLFQVQTESVLNTDNTWSIYNIPHFIQGTTHTQTQPLDFIQWSAFV